MTGRGRSRGGRQNTLDIPVRGHGRGSGRGRGAPTAAIFHPQPSYPAFPDPIARQKEDAFPVSPKPIQSSDIQFPVRPGFGTRGREIVLWTNYFELTGYGDLVLHRYSIAISADRNGKTPEGKKLKRTIQILLEDHLDQYHPNIVSDYGSTILSKQELNVPDHYNVGYRDEEEETPPQDTVVYQIKLQHTGVLSTSELLDYVTSMRTAELFSSRTELLQALNLVIGHYPKSTAGVVSTKTNAHYDTRPTTVGFDLGASLQAVRGFFSSVRLATARVLVNVQVKNAAFYTAGPLDGIMLAFMRENGTDRIELQKFVARLSVNAIHLTRRSGSGQIITHIKHIAGLANRRNGSQQQKPPVVPEFGAGPKDVKFYLASGDQQPSRSDKSAEKATTKGSIARAPNSGQYISVFDFFRQNYSITIRDTSLPVVNVGASNNPVYLPAQVCETQAMMKFAVRSPEQNATSIATTGTQTLGLSSANITLDTFDLKVNNQLLSVVGRVLASPNVLYRGSGLATTRFGSWNLQRVQLSTPTNLPYWTYLAISFQGRARPWGSEKNLESQIGEFIKKLREVGINTAPCTPGMPLEITTGDADAQIAAAIHRFMNSPNRPPPKFLLVILPTRDTLIYNRLKHVCDVKEGLLNLCVVSSKFMKPNNDQYFANVALKVNLKLGGNNHTLDSSKLGILAKGKTMVVGLDVTHPSPGSAKSAPSVAGIVASVDQWLGQWPGELSILPPRQEIISGLQELIRTRLKAWQQKHKTLPENILVYRDGVSEGQYNQVLDVELPSFRNACKELYSAKQTHGRIPRITIIIAGKRHNTRFYPTRIEDADRSSNPPNGTVVDRGITEARNWDFFLQAHTAIQGTARPAHYFIVIDEIFRANWPLKAPFASSADVLEDLTHNLCYLFGRATKAVSICPPAYYADLLCERARCYLSGVFDPEAAETASTSTQSTQTTDMSGTIKVHPNVKDTMFYL